MYYPWGSITLGWVSNKQNKVILQIAEIHSACPIWRCTIQKCLWKLARHVLGHLDFKWSAMTRDDKNSQGHKLSRTHSAKTTAAVE